MEVTVNGEKQKYETKTIALLELIQINKVQQPDMVSVQLNGEFVDRSKFAVTKLKNGDEIDFLFFMGGGSL